MFSYIPPDKRAGRDACKLAGAGQGGEIAPSVFPLPFIALCTSFGASLTQPVDRHNAEQYASMSIEAVAVKCAAFELNQSSAESGRALADFIFLASPVTQ